jgi:hypothetical protein
MRWARAQTAEHGLTPTEAHVLLVAATYADLATAECRASVDTIAADVGRGKSAAERALRKLASEGLIVRRRRGPGKPAITRLNLPTDPSPATDLDAPPATDQAPVDPSPVTDQDPSSATAKTRHPRRTNNQKDNQNNRERSPKPADHDLDDLTAQVAKLLTDALDFLPPNDHGRPWPQPSLATIRQALVEHQASPFLARRVAEQTKVTVQHQGKAPNIAGLFARKLADAYSDERKQARQEIANSLASAGGRE